jgi:p-hydroxybenzoate 3-monooxygenase
VPQLNPELFYASRARGFVLASMRSAARSRYYIQCQLMNVSTNGRTSVSGTSFASVWGQRYRKTLCQVPRLKRTIAPSRSFVI